MTALAFKTFNTTIFTTSVMSATYSVDACQTVGITVDTISTCGAF
jgi:hypothetical protein